MSTLDRETRQLINAARTLGTESLSIYLEDDELLRLCAVIAADLGISHIVDELVEQPELLNGYYAVPLAWFSRSVSSASRFSDVFARMKAEEADFPTYFKSLSELHKRRRKFQLILEHQALPQMEQLVPRCLLEYGLKPRRRLLLGWYGGSGSTTSTTARRRKLATSLNQS